MIYPVRKAPALLLRLSDTARCLLPENAMTDNKATPHLHQGEPTGSRSCSSQHDGRGLGDSLWEELAEGRFVVRASGHSATHCGLELARCLAKPLRSDGERRQIDYLRRMLIGEAQKVVAFATERSVATIAEASRHSLSLLGLECGLLYVPYLLVRAAHVASGLALPPCRVERRGFGLTWYVSVERPDLHLGGVLSESERQVAALMLEGYPNEAIAQRRDVSVRTIANQIRSVFRKLEISGRNELLCTLVRHERAHWGYEACQSGLRRAQGARG